MAGLIYHALIRAIKFILIPMLTVILFYRKRKQKPSVNPDLILDFGLAVAGNVVAMNVVMLLLQKAAMRFWGMELPYNKCYAVISVLLAVFLFPKLLELFPKWTERVFHKSAVETVKCLLDYCFLIAIAVVCFGTQLGLTTFYFNLPYSVYRNLYLLTCLAAGLKVALSVTEKSLTFDEERHLTGMFREMFQRNRDLLLSIPVALVFYLAFPSEHYLYQQFLAPLIIGCVGMRLRKIFQAAFIPSALVILVMMVASQSGAIYSMASSGRNIRSYWGHISPTDFGTAVLMIVAFLWVYYNNLREEFFLLPAVFSLFISFSVTRCNTSGFLTLLLLVMLFARGFGRRVIDKKGIFQWAKKVVDRVLVLVFPVLGILVLIMVYAYYKELPFAGTLDTIFHQRLSPAADMLAEHGLKLFGTYFDMIGNGGSVIHRGSKYTFIDSSYPQILIRYGVVTYILANILWMYTTRRALRTGHRCVAYVMALLAVDFVMEHHWYELCYNVFVLIPFADFGTASEVRGERQEDIAEANVKRGVENQLENRNNRNEKKHGIILSGMCLVQLLVAFLLLPTAFSWLRTIFNGLGLSGGGRNGIVVFAAITVVLMTSIGFIKSLSVFVADMFTEKKTGKTVVISLIVAGILGLTGLVVGNIQIGRITDVQRERIEDERSVLELITSNASGKVYADKLPEAYIRTIDGISRSYLCGEDFARYDNITVITEAEWDSLCLSGRGFLYLPISDEDAIYTNDDSVIRALQENGYKLKGYNSYEHMVDLVKLSEMNDVGVLNNGGILLAGTEHQLIHGPYLSILDGRFTAKYEMKLLQDHFSPEEKICTVKVSSYAGTQVKATVDLYRSDFDEKGKLEYEVAFDGNGQNYEFLVMAEPEAVLEIDSITYRRTPEVDTHETIDQKGRVIRAEYFDSDGNPKEASGDYYGYECAYDDNDNVIMQRYLGIDFKPVIIDKGYAEIHKEYNLQKDVTEESYFGIEGEPIELSGGYHSLKKEYDFYRNPISESYFDLEGKPVLKSDAYFKFLRTYNEDRRWIRTEYYDTEENLILQKEGYAIIERDYDSTGNVTEERYYGLQGEPVLYGEKYHKSVKTYNEQNRCIKELFYGTDGEPILQSGSYSGYTREYDNTGNIVKQTYLGADGEPVTTDWGYVSWRRAYNSKKQVVQESYYDVNDEKTTRPGGQFAVEFEYDEVGNRISDAYFDRNDERICTKNSYWKVVRTYNEKRQKIREEYFDTNEKPMLISNKYSGTDFIYDDDGKLVKKILKDLEGNVVEEVAA